MKLPTLPPTDPQLLTGYLLSHRYIAVCVIFLFFSVQCAREHSEMDTLLTLPMKEQEENFKNFPLSKQVDVGADE